MCCDEKGVAAFQLLRHRQSEPKNFITSEGGVQN